MLGNIVWIIFLPAVTIIILFSPYSEYDWVGDKLSYGKYFKLYIIHINIVLKLEFKLFCLVYKPIFVLIDISPVYGKNYNMSDIK